MFKYAFQEVRLHISRMVATLIAISISVAFISGAAIFVSTSNKFSNSISALPLTKTDVVVSFGIDALQNNYAENHKKINNILESDSHISSYYSHREPNTMTVGTQPNSTTISIYDLPPQDMRWSKLKEGHWPKNDQEIVLSKQAAATTRAKVGQKIEINDYSDKAKTLVGISDDPSSLVLSIGYIKNDKGLITSNILIKAAKGISPQQLINELQPKITNIQKDITLKTVNQLKNDHRNDFNSAMSKSQNTSFKYFLWAFAAITTLVAMIVIANTFTILVTQRRRQIGLLRAVAATGSQVRRQIITESILIGIIGASLGILLGCLLATLGCYFMNTLYFGLEIPWYDLIFAFFTGTIITLLATLIPSIKATKISPLEALSTVPSITEEKKTSRLKLIFCSLFATLGICLIILSKQPSKTASNVGIAFILAIAAGICLTIAILGAAPSYVPTMLKVFGKIFGHRSATARLAAKNSARNPKRAAATAVALMLSMGLITTIQVTVTSAKASVADSIAKHFAVDLSVGQKQEIPANIKDKIIHLPSVKRYAILETKNIKVNGTDKVAIKAASTLKNWSADVANDITDNVALTSGNLSEKNIKFTAGNKTFNLKNIGTKTLSDDLLVVVSNKVFDEIPGKTIKSYIWLQFKDNTDATKVYSNLDHIRGNLTDFKITGTIWNSALINKFFDLMLAILTVLLGVAVIVAMVGVANTLSLSVIERKREFALLRALGMQRSNIKLLLLFEAIMLALIGALVGLVAGIFFGWLATSILFAPTLATATWTKYTFAIDWKMTILVFLAVLIAASLASLLPGRKAAKAAPVEALAED